MPIELPKELKSDIPQTLWGKILSSTPVVMTVIATMLAGMASSEMNRAQYDRALAAQLQSKAGDQWALYQAKRLRGALQRSTLDAVQASAPVRPVDPEALRKTPDAAGAGSAGELSAFLETPEGQAALGAVQPGGVAGGPGSGSFAPEIKAALDALAAGRPESEILLRTGKIDDASLAAALQVASDRSSAFDAAKTSVNLSVDRAEALLAKAAASGDAEARSRLRDWMGARLLYSARRYDAEAKLNQDIASLYELQVRKSNVSAERRHTRSQRFFYGMLAAQTAVIIATFAIAARKKNFLWSLAALAGLGAIAFAAYVYLWT